MAYWQRSASRECALLATRNSFTERENPWHHILWRVYSYLHNCMYSSCWPASLDCGGL